MFTVDTVTTWFILGGIMAMGGATFIGIACGVLLSVQALRDCWRVKHRKKGLCKHE